MQDFQGNDLQVGDSVIFFNLTGGKDVGMQNGIIMGILRVGHEHSHIAQIAIINRPEQPLIAVNRSAIHRTSTDYRGTHPTHLGEIFPYAGKKSLGEHTFNFGAKNTQ